MPQHWLSPPGRQLTPIEPAPGWPCAAAVASACGTRHASNEDAHSPAAADAELFVVADGVGGGALAGMASRLLVAHLHQALSGSRVDAQRVRSALLDADRTLAQRIARLTDAPGAATLVLCRRLNLAASRWLVAWVGDCRAYRFSAGRLEALTRDDTFAHLGEAPPHGGSPDDPARMVGNGAISGANVACHALAPGDVLALCSDGVHKHVPARDWCRLLRAPIPLAQCADALVALARANGSTDDATVLLLRRAAPELP